MLRTLTSCLLVVLLGFTAAGARDQTQPTNQRTFASQPVANQDPVQDPVREEEPLRDLLELQGTWQLVTLEEEGKKVGDLGKRELFVGGTVFLFKEEEKVVQAGNLRLVPARKPSAIDATVKSGRLKGNTMLGVYELKGELLKVCFDPDGDARPKEFGSKAGSPRYVAIYKRSRPKDEPIDIVTRYRAESVGPDGTRQVVGAEIQRHGDAYLVKWTRPAGVLYVGVGIRNGNTLSVAWMNRGSVGTSLYKIEKGPKLMGTFTELGGIGLISQETLTPGSATREEVREIQEPRENRPAAEQKQAKRDPQ